MMATQEEECRLKEEDELAFAVQTGEDILGQLSMAKQDDPPSNHVKDLTRALFMAKRRLARLDNAHASAGANNDGPGVRRLEDHLTQETRDDHGTNVIQTAEPVQQPRIRAKLPTLELPPFGGDVAEYTSFRARFHAAVEDAPGLTDEVKLIYLLGCLRGPASQLVKELPPTAAGYASAKALLNEAYDRPAAAQLGHWKALLEIQQVGAGAQRLRQFQMAVEAHVRALECSGVLAAEGEFLPTFLAAKIPGDLRLRWERKRAKRAGGSADFDEGESISGSASGTTRSTLASFRAFLKNEVEAAEAIDLMDANPTSPKSSERKAQPAVSATRALNVQAGRHDKRQRAPCIRDLPEGQRLAAVNEHQLCGNCLGHGHFARRCGRPRCRTCGQRHHALLHGEIEGARKQQGPGQRHGGERGENGVFPSHPQSTSLPTGSATPRLNQQTSRVFAAATGQSLLQTALVKVRMNGGVQQEVRALLDPGAEDCFFHADLIRNTNGQAIDEATFQVIGFGEQSQGEQKYQRYELEIMSREGAFLLRGWATERLCSSPRGRVTPALGEAAEPEGLADPTPGDGRPIMMTIGADALPSILKMQAPRRVNNFVLTPTIFGWVTLGSNQKVAKDVRCLTATRAPPNVRLQDLWDLETLSIDVESEALTSLPPAKLDVEGHYEVRLPFKSAERPKANRYEAEKRLDSVLKTNPERRGKYERYMRDLQDSRIIEEVPEEQARSIRHFLPHHGVWREGKALRVVFDGSAGLNQTLDTGPNLVNHMVEVIISARLADLLMMCDIKGAFLCVAVHPDDRQFLAFLWRRAGRNVVMKFRRVPFGTNASPFLLQHALGQLLEDAEADGHGALAQRLRSSLFVDDLALPISQGEDTQELRVQIEMLFARASMQLHKFRVSGDRGEGSILGLLWSSETDTLPLRIQMSNELRTKRQLLSAFAALYDPLGLRLPWSVTLRLIFQRLWTRGVDWDEALPADEQEVLDKCIAGAQEFADMRVPRSTGHPESIHVFADASLVAYCAAIYVKSGEASHLLIAKARVAPLRPKLTMPRMELMAALLATKLYNKIRPRTSTDATFYTDSSIVLSWIRNGPEKYRSFVRNRLVTILETTTASSWKKVSTSNNPADLGTRGITASALRASALWWHGPDYGQEQLPEQESIDDQTKQDAEREERKSMVVVTAHLDDDNAEEFEEFVSTFSTLPRLVTAAVWVRRWLPGSQHSGKSQAEERAAAFAGLLRRAQDVQREDIGTRTRVGPDNLRCALTRTGEQLPILPRGALAKLVVEDVHRTLYHQGTGAVLAEMHSNYYGIGREFVKRTVTACIPCRREKARTSKPPEGGLPSSRITPARPFETCGIDFWGPIFCDGDKAWVLIASCAVTRAVHLELVRRQTAEETALALRRLAAARGPLRQVYCDNARTFRKLATLTNITWRFIPERSPQNGGFYERMVGVVKRAFKITMRNQQLTFSEATTVLAEISERINRRPLTTWEGLDGEVPLTPAHFIYGGEPPRLGPLMPHGDGDNLTFQKRFLRTQAITEQLWTRWKREYLPTLRQWRSKQRKPCALDVGAVVIVEEDGIKRSKWPLGRIVSLIPGKDGHSRAAFVRMKGIVTRRHLNRLIPLEVDAGAHAQLKPTAGHASAPIKPPEASGADDQPKPMVGERTRCGREIRKPKRFQD
jgi:hypothetical protein